jgi:hypothetical protein
LHVSVREELPAARDVVWGLLRDFADVSAFLPDLRVSRISGFGTGAVRHVETPSGLFIERCEAHNEAGRTVSYTVDAAPPSFPYRNYHAVFKLTDAGPENCSIEWCCDFDTYTGQAAALTKSLESLYRDTFIANLRRTLRAR